jgi:hypothetical protein
MQTRTRTAQLYGHWNFNGIPAAKSSLGGAQIQQTPT